MTIIVGYRRGSENWIAGDSLGSSGDGFKMDLGSKLIHKTGYTIGVAGSYRTMDLLREAPSLPRGVRGLDDIRVLRDWIKLVHLEDGCQDRAGSDETVAHPFSALVASPAGIWAVEGDYQLHRVTKYYAIGCGRDAALGALYVMAARNQPGDVTVRSAVRAAMLHNINCGGRVFLKKWVSAGRSNR